MHFVPFNMFVFPKRRPLTNYRLDIRDCHKSKTLTILRMSCLNMEAPSFGPNHVRVQCLRYDIL